MNELLRLYQILNEQNPGSISQKSLDFAASLGDKPNRYLEAERLEKLQSEPTGMILHRVKDTTNPIQNEHQSSDENKNSEAQP